jgi:hypothetical protein
MLLVSDASGFASFKAHSFVDAKGAADWAHTWYGARLEKDNGIIAFWAMTEQPQARPGEAPVEAIVLVRDAKAADVIYPFSFVDLGEAQDFVRFEMGRGVDPNLIQVYWAVPVQVGLAASGAVRISPETAPEALRQTTGQAASPARVPLTEWTVSKSAVKQGRSETASAPAKHDKISEEAAESIIENTVTGTGGEEMRIGFDSKQAVGAPAPVAMATAGTQADEAQRGASPAFDVKEELQKVLKVRRWDERETPFSGFDSPPGRF